MKPLFLFIAILLLCGLGFYGWQNRQEIHALLPARLSSVLTDSSAVAQETQTPPSASASPKIITQADKGYSSTIKDERIQVELEGMQNDSSQVVTLPDTLVSEWVALYQDSAYAISSLVQVDSNVIALASLSGVYVSHDGGKSFQRTLDKACKHLKIDAAGALYVIAKRAPIKDSYRWDYSDLMRSTDGGKTWQYLRLPPPNPREPSWNLEIENYVVDHHNHFYYINSSYHLWRIPFDEKLDIRHLRMGQPVVKLEVNPSGILYLVETDGNIYYSNHFGESWENIKTWQLASRDPSHVKAIRPAGDGWFLQTSSRLIYTLDSKGEMVGYYAPVRIASKDYTEYSSLFQLLPDSSLLVYESGHQQILHLQKNNPRVLATVPVDQVGEVTAMSYNPATGKLFMATRGVGKNIAHAYISNPKLAIPDRFEISSRGWLISLPVKFGNNNLALQTQQP